MKSIKFIPFFLVYAIFSAEGQTKVNMIGAIEWRKMEITAEVTINLLSAGIRMPAGRVHAEEIISDEYPHLVRPHLLDLPVDSSSTLGDMLNRGEFSLLAIDTISLGGKKIPPALSTDLAVMSAHYTVNLDNLSASLIRHTRPQDTIRVLTPAPVSSYTGIIIIADDTLPIHGRNAEAYALPCIFPKIWDSDMNLIYERNMLDPAAAQRMARYVGSESIFQSTPSGLEAELKKLVGDNPLRIIARGVFGIRPTDPIIDREDALLIVSSESNRRLLREGKVAIVLNSEVLSNTF
ncbi:MAG: polymerase [Spirochaetaceae bacterium]|jgi:hypothetical protein|nr:polymerase [Spirochaetaceae bacterium]